MTELPDFDLNGNLPPGIHWITWNAFCREFGYTTWRKRLCDGLYIGITSLAKVGCKAVYVDGSFVTTKDAPNDFDACWDDRGVDWDKLIQIDPTILSFENLRAAQKVKYGGEFFPASFRANAYDDIFLSFFQMDREGNPKGIVAIDLNEIRI